LLLFFCVKHFPFIWCRPVYSYKIGSTPGQPWFVRASVPCSKTARRNKIELQEKQDRLGVAARRRLDSTERSTGSKTGKREGRKRKNRVIGTRQFQKTRIHVSWRAAPGGRQGQDSNETPRAGRPSPTGRGCCGFVNRFVIGVGVCRFVEGGEHGEAIRDGGSTSLLSFRSRNGGEILRAAIIHYMATSARLQ
jgi:hypothetical protein